MPPDAAGVVVFAHGSGSRRLSPRNRAVAGALVQDGLATLLFDLLTAEKPLDAFATRSENEPLCHDRASHGLTMLVGTR